jgi:hypothetical protein
MTSVPNLALWQLVSNCEQPPSRSTATHAGTPELRSEPGEEMNQTERKVREMINPCSTAFSRWWCQSGRYMRLVQVITVGKTTQSARQQSAGGLSREQMVRQVVRPAQLIRLRMKGKSYSNSSESSPLRYSCTRGRHAGGGRSSSSARAASISCASAWRCFDGGSVDTYEACRCRKPLPPGQIRGETRPLGACARWPVGRSAPGCACDDLRLAGLKLTFLIAARAVPLLGLSRGRCGGRTPRS